MSTTAQVARPPARVLLVDDEPHSLALLEVMLKPEGYHLQTASTGQQALAIIDQDFPDLILLDVMMPGLDGYQVAQKVKSTYATSKIPIIVVTALDSRAARLRGLEVGAEDFLTKPVNRDELCLRVRNLLRLKAYGDHHDRYSRLLETEVSSHRSQLIENKSFSDAALRQERDRGRRYIDASEVILLALDLEGRIALVNRYACNILGWSAEELIGRDWADTCLPVRLRDAIRKRMHNVRPGDNATSHNVVITRSGDERLIEWSNTLEYDEAGEVSGTFSSGTDITDRTAACEALQVAEERIRFALTNANVGVWDIDYTTGKLRWSEILEAQYGLQPGTFGGTLKDFFERIHPDDLESVANTIREAAKTGSDFSVLNRTILPDGSIRWLSGTGRLHLGPDGEAVRGVGISQDVTERRTLEAQAGQANKLDAIGQLAGGVSHDFNNLLGVILGQADLLANNLVDEKLRGRAESIIRAARHGASLTHQLLAFSRSQAVEPTVISLNDLVTDTVKLLGRTLGAEIHLVTHLADDLWPISVDPGQMQQILLNLAINSRDAMPSGGELLIVTSNLAAGECPEPPAIPGAIGDCVVLSVTDTGQGMTAEVREKIFEPFFTTKAEGKGTGLGLAMVYGIVKQNNGHIRVTSEPSQGTAFHIYFKRAHGLQDEPAVLPAPAHGTETILVVEDQELVREVVVDVLREYGYTVLEAADGKQALEVLAQQNGDLHLVITDLIMPEMSGQDLARRVRCLQPSAKLLFISGYAGDSAQRQALVGDIPLLQKPFSPAVLAAKAREVLDAPPLLLLSPPPPVAA